MIKRGETKRGVVQKEERRFNGGRFQSRRSHHVGVLVLQLVQLFALLPQKQDSADGRTSIEMKAFPEDLRADSAPASPLFAQRGLNFAHSDQRAEVLHLSADLRHVQAAHVVEVLVRPGRLVVREEPLLDYF